MPLCPLSCHKNKVLGVLVVPAAAVFPPKLWCRVSRAARSSHTEIFTSLVVSSGFLQLNARGAWPGTKNSRAALRAPWARWTKRGRLGRAAEQHNSAAGRAPWAGVCKQEHELMPEHLTALQRGSAATALVPGRPRGALQGPSPLIWAAGLVGLCVTSGPLCILG